MPYHAIMPSPLGDILLQADAGHLSGLYFVGQRDCPDLPGHAPMHAADFDPAAGMLGGRPMRLLRVLDPAVAPGVDGRAAPARRGKAPPVSLAIGAPRFQEPDTPPSTQAVLQQAAGELAGYFAGQCRHFTVPVAPVGTAFQRKVWDALLTIGCGETVSYGEVARRAGLEARHSRAVGAAVGANPISIIIPCHRVLAANGTLNGYGGGLTRKMRLLQLEGCTVH